MIVIGITGSIGMGKSTVGSMLMREGVPVHEADEAVHLLLQPGSEAQEAIHAAFPYFDYQEIYGKKNRQGARHIKRKAMANLIFEDEEEREKLEGILHPLVRKAQAEFIRNQKKSGRRIVALDIPLLFETGAETMVDLVINVSAPFHIQSQRVMQRPGMTEEKFAAILKRQMPDGEKRVRADYIVETGLGRAYAMKSVKNILHKIRLESDGENLNNRSVDQDANKDIYEEL